MRATERRQAFRNAAQLLQVQDIFSALAYCMALFPRLARPAGRLLFVFLAFRLPLLDRTCLLPHVF